MFATWLHFLFHFNFTGFAKYILYIFLPASCDERVLTYFGGKSKNNHDKALGPENAMKFGCYHLSWDIFGENSVSQKPW